ncbi:LysR family transcriptional regulator [Litoreibacter roseus]|uniref:LysR family transcriptional regulator n=1 Tax=Litoreibacter roseus TaxID=2601869 RepID=A0A6N6JCE4_9RHOB|nr:LysR family transcriptional regulator [Litoreibacter roseus]GFE63826.1 LysR family transcriptional regulator [Litoreibacter roseus]
MISALSLEQLRVLVAVADEGSFSAAGRALGRVQSAISQTVANIEDVQRVTIFDRSTYRPTLTNTGRALVDQARHVLASAARFERIARGAAEGLEPELRLTVDPLVPSAPLVHALQDVRDHYPDLPISFSTEALGGPLRRVRDGTAVLGVCTLLPAVPEDVRAYALMRTRMLPVVAQSHPLATLGRPAKTMDLADYVQLVLSDPVDPSGPNFGLASPRVWRFSDLHRRLDFLAAGFGWCRMPEHIIHAYLSDGRLVRIEAEEDTATEDGLPIYATHLRQHPCGPATRLLLDRLQTHTA